MHYEILLRVRSYMNLSIMQYMVYMYMYVYVYEQYIQILNILYHPCRSDGVIGETSLSKVCDVDQ